MNTTTRKLDGALLEESYEYIKESNFVINIENFDDWFAPHGAALREIHGLWATVDEKDGKAVFSHKNQHNWDALVNCYLQLCASQGRECYERKAKDEFRRLFAEAQAWKDSVLSMKDVVSEYIRANPEDALMTDDIGELVVKRLKERVELKKELAISRSANAVLRARAKGLEANVKEMQERVKAAKDTIADSDEWIAGLKTKVKELETALKDNHTYIRRRSEESLLADVVALRNQLAELEEKHNLQLAAISTACLGNIPARRESRLERGHPYWTPAYQDACDAVDREIRERDEKEYLVRRLKTIHKDSRV